MTLNYSRPDANFLETRIHYLGQKGTGRTTSEFPVMYYTIGRIWHLIGVHVALYRAIIMGIFFIGLLALYGTIADILNHFRASSFDADVHEPDAGLLCE